MPFNSLYLFQKMKKTVSFGKKSPRNGGSVASLDGSVDGSRASMESVESITQGDRSMSIASSFAKGVGRTLSFAKGVRQ